MLDTQLNAMGKQQAELVGQRLSSDQFDVIYCSDLSRCKQVSSGIIIAYTPIQKVAETSYTLDSGWYNQFPSTNPHYLR